MQINGIILANEQIYPSYYKMIIEAPEIAARAEAGQFVHIRCTKGNYPLLRRPLSLHRIEKNTGKVVLLYKIVGEGTAILSKFHTGEAIDLLGPLGNGFAIPENIKHALLVAGGMGIVPLYALAEKLISMSVKTTLCYGARNAGELFCLDDFAALGIDIATVTDDGSSGKRGYVTDLLADITNSNNFDYVYLCGPRPMLRAAVRLCLKKKLSGQVSLEEYMACGIGACLGCVCKIKPAHRDPYNEWVYKKVCSDGPVFLLDEVIIDE